MSNLRDKFKDSTTSDALKAQDQKLDSALGINRSDRAKFLEIKDGVNKFRIYPPHPDSNAPFIVPKQVWWLPTEYTKKDKDGNVVKDKKGNPVIKTGRRPVFDARIHSKQKVDVVQEYIEFVNKELTDQNLTDEEIRQLMLPIKGSYNERVQGIIGKPGYIMYVDKIEGNSRIFGRLEVGRAVKNRINELIAIEESNQPIGTMVANPLTDIEEGRLLIVTYNSKADKAGDYYKTELDSSYDPETKKINFYPLSDEDLEKLLDQPSLEELYVDSYTQRDFNYAIEGLRLFDQEHGYDVFSNDEFLERCEELVELYPEPKNKPDNKKSEDKEEEVESEEADEKAEEKPKVKKATGGSKAKKKEEQPDPEQEEDGQPEDEQPEEEEKPKKKESTKERLARLRKKMDK